MTAHIEHSGGRRVRYPASNSCRIDGVDQPISEFLSGEERRIAHKMVDWEFSFEAIQERKAAA